MLCAAHRMLLKLGGGRLARLGGRFACSPAAACSSGARVQKRCSTCRNCHTDLRTHAAHKRSATMLSAFQMVSTHNLPINTWQHHPPLSPPGQSEAGTHVSSPREMYCQSLALQFLCASGNPTRRGCLVKQSVHRRGQIHSHPLPFSTETPCHVGGSAAVTTVPT